MVKISDLKVADYNPRQMSADQAKDLKASIEKFGFVNPILANSHPDRHNVLIGGHQRLRIAAEMGLTEVPVMYVNLDLKGEQELNLRLNKNVGEWDWSMLANFDESQLKESGFSKAQIDYHFDDEVKAKIKEKRKKLITCPECNKQFTL